MAFQKLPEKYKKWIDARNKYHLSDAHIQMAQELGMNPKKFCSLANNKQEPWKLSLPEFIEECYCKRFRKERPDQVMSIENRVKEVNRKNEEKHQEKLFPKENTKSY